MTAQKTRPNADVMVLSAHPDDAEISCGGTIIKLTQRGTRVVLVDLSRGEMATRGTPETRAEEAEQGRRLLGAAERINLGLPDTQLEDSAEAREAVAAVIRRFRPGLLLTHFEHDAHPDHEAAGQIARRAVFQAGLAKMMPDLAPHRPRRIVRFQSHLLFDPSFCVDISDVFEQKMHAVKAFASQWAGEDNSHFQGGMDPLDRLETRNRFFGNLIGVRHAEAFAVDGPVPLDELSALV